jgi:hypothetical protein
MPADKETSTMRKKTAATLLAAGLVTGGGAALFVPTMALAADSSTDSTATDRASARLTAIKDALKGLVSDGTITQSQADKVARTLAEADLGERGGRGGHGRGAGRVTPEATAKVIGITVDQLRSAQEAGRTLAQIAQAHGVGKSDLVKGLVAAAEAQLAADVKAGTITQAQADQLAAGLTERITERVDRAGRGFGRGGPGGSGGPGDRGPAGGGSTAMPTPSASGA